MNFDEAEAGTCLIWHLSFEDGLTGAEVGLNAADLEGCYDLSNPVVVNRTGADGGTVATIDGETEIILDLGSGQNATVEFDSTGAVADGYVYLVTDEDNNILLVAETNSISFDNAGVCICRVWGLAYSGMLLAEEGQNAAEAMLSSDCFDLSDNFVTVNRIQSLQVFLPEGGSLENGDEMLEMRLAPNPATDLLRVEWEQPAVAAPQELHLQIFQLDGKLRYQAKLPVAQLRTTIDVSYLPTGTYLLRLNNGEQLVTKRFIKA